MENRGNVMDVLSLINVSRSMKECIMVEKLRCQRRSAPDYSNPRDWMSVKLILQNVNVKAACKSGYMIMEVSGSFESDGITLRFKR